MTLNFYDMYSDALTDRERLQVCAQSIEGLNVHMQEHVTLSGCVSVSLGDLF